MARLTTLMISETSREFGATSWRTAGASIREVLDSAGGGSFQCAGICRRGQLITIPCGTHHEHAAHGAVPRYGLGAGHNSGGAR